MNKKEQRKLNLVKNKAYLLKENGQIPISLYRAILGLNYESNVESVSKLCELTEHFIRVKGYYFRFPENDKECGDVLARLGF